MNKIYLLSLSVLFLYCQSSLADMNTANNALARGDYAVAAAEFQKLAEKGDKKAQAHLGYLYYVGEGVEQNHEKAVMWYRKAAILGDRDSQYNLAVAYAFGEGVKQDYKEAFQWYRRAAEQNHAVAQYSLGVSYAYGEGIPQDPALAAEWFQKSAEQGYERAQILLGSIYHTGDGVEKDYAQAAIWYRKAADKGNAVGQYNLGTLYRSGYGVVQDYNQAIRWFRLSADQGYAEAQNELASMEKAIAGANRSPVSVPEIVNESSRVVVNAADAAPANQQSKAPSDETATPLAAEIPLAEPEIVVDNETAIKKIPEDKAPKRGFFSRLFAGKDVDDTEEKSASEQVAEITPAEEQPAALPEWEDPDLSDPLAKAASETFTDSIHATPDAVNTDIAIAENAEQLIDQSSVVMAEPEIVVDNETAIEKIPEDKAPKRGFFSRLFAGKDADNTEEKSASEQVAEITPAEEQPAALPEWEDPDLSDPLAKAASETFTDSIHATPDAVNTDIAIAENAEQLIDQSSAVMAEPEIVVDNETAIEKIPEDKAPKRGFFSRLFAGKDADNTEEKSAPEQVAEIAPPEEQPAALPEWEDPDLSDPLAKAASETFTDSIHATPDAVNTDIAIAENAEQSIDESSAVMAKPETVVDNETAIEKIPEDKAPKKGFFSRLFAGKDADNTEEKSASKEVAEIAPPEEEPILIAKLEDLDLSDSLGEGAGETFIKSINATTDAVNTADPSDIRALAVKGDANAQFQLGTLYHQGKNVKLNYSQAFLWYRRAAQQGLADAQYSLGNMYLMGEGIGQDDYQARQWYEKASEQDHEGAQHNLKSLQRIAIAEPAPKPEYDPDNNILPKQNDEIFVAEPEEKKGFFEKLFGKDDVDEKEPDETDVPAIAIEASEAEQFSTDNSEIIDVSPSSIYEKGLAFEFGEGVSQSYQTAFEFFKKSAIQNHAPAQYKVGLAYAYGQGVEKDPVLATEWYEKSAAQGYALAQRTLATLYMSNHEGIEQNKPLALAWYDILADGGNAMDVYKRDTLRDKLTQDEIDEANRLRQALTN